MTGKKVIFVGGSSYSGSTLLDMMLSNGDAGFSTGEVYALFYPYRPHHINPECGCGNPACTVWQEIKSKGVSNLYHEIFKRYPDVQYIVDSSKDPFWFAKHANFLKGEGVDVRYVVIWKTPQEFALSWLKRGHVEGWERPWKNYYKLYFSMIERWISVKYSDLAIKPEKTLERLCKEIGIDYFEGKEQYWKYTHHTLFGNTSAKIHLHSKGSDVHDRHSRALVKQTNDTASAIRDKHRTIYYDSDFKEVQKAVSDVADRDYEIGLILDLHQATTAGSDRNENRIEKLRDALRIPFYRYILYKVHRLSKRFLSRRHEARQRK